ncbi:MAG: activator of HSP90 ATPase [Bacteroidetes bacterium]|nr:activator of HSP90 ATPase [Bacteroidota bacterium]
MTKITIQTIVNADVQKAWDYYNKPEHIVHWNFASDDWHCPSAEVDLRVGGMMKSRMEAKDGSFGFDFGANYNVVENLKKIVYTIPDGRVVEITFNDQSGKTEIIIVFDAESINPVEMQKSGWQAILNNYSKYTEDN